MIKSYKLGELIIENPKSKIKVRDAKNVGDYIFFTSGEKNKYHKNFLCEGKNIFIATGGKANFKYYEGKASYSTDCYSIKTKEFIDTKFLFFYLKLKMDEINKKMFLGAALKHLQKKQFKEIKIKIPPLAEQKRIVSKLDTAFAEINKIINTNKIKTVNKLKVQILNSKLNNLNYAYKNTNIGAICELAYGKGLDKSDRKEDSGYPAFGANGIKCFATKYIYDKPSIIIGRKGSAGELKYVKEPFWALDVTYFIKYNSKLVDLKYLYYLLKLQNLPSLAKGVKPGINRNEVYSIPILLPTLEKQRIIAKEIDYAFKQFEIINNLEKLKLENYEKLKMSLLNDELQRKVA